MTAALAGQPAANDNAKPRKTRFNIIRFDDVNQTVAKEYVVQGLIGAGEFSLWVAKPGTGKSVLVGDIGLHIAAGKDWHGRKVKQGLVVFFAAERKKLTERRVAAWRKKHGVKNIPFVVVVANWI
jgi:RecA-family ATPase